MDIRQRTRTALQYKTGAFNNILEHDCVEEAPEANSEAILGMLADIDILKKNITFYCLS